MNRLPIALAAVFLGSALAAPSPAFAIPMDTVVIQGLDKITAQVSTIQVPVGGTVAFGALQITARACDKHPPEETPEAAAFLEIVEVKPDEKPVLRFSGWMFASSPALSGLEHPVYDVIVLDCVNRDNGAPPDTGDEDAPADPATKPATDPGAKPANQAPSNSSKTSGGNSQ